MNGNDGTTVFTSTCALCGVVWSGSHTCPSVSLQTPTIDVPSIMHTSGYYDGYRAAQADVARAAETQRATELSMQVCTCGHERARHCGCGGTHHEGSPHAECCDETGCPCRNFVAVVGDIPKSYKDGYNDGLDVAASQLEAQQWRSLAAKIRNLKVGVALLLLVTVPGCALSWRSMKAAGPAAEPTEAQRQQCAALDAKPMGWNVATIIAGGLSGASGLTSIVVPDNSAVVYSMGGVAIFVTVFGGIAAYLQSAYTQRFCRLCANVVPPL